MNDDYYWDYYETFREQIEDQLENLENYILALNNPETVSESLDELFKIFKAYESTAAYLKLKPLQEISLIAETTLASLREEKKVVQESIIEWLLQIKDLLDIWFEQMQNNEVNLQEIPAEINQKIKISKSYISPSQRLKSLSLLYIDANDTRANKISSFFKKILKDVKITTLSEYQSHIKDFDIVMINLGKDNFSVINYCIDNFNNLPLITVFDSISKEDKINLLKLGVSQFITNPLNSKILQKELIFITKTYFCSKNVLIDNKKINTFIQSLKPLPITILQISQVCDDEDKSIGDLIKIVKSDPIIAANILKAASSPIYGSVELATVDQAIARLGKTAIKALTMDGIYEDQIPIKLSPYSIDQKQFSTISQMRLSLMLKWYSKVSISDLSILSSTALLGNIGQLLISQELIDINEEDNFKKLCELHDVNYAEEALVHTTTCLVSSQVLRYWQLSDEIIDVISYSDNYLEAPLEIKKLVFANYVVYSLIDIMGNVLENIPDNILDLMKEFDLDPDKLVNALNFILENK